MSKQSFSWGKTVIVIDSSAFSNLLMREKGCEKIVPYLDTSLKPYAVDILTIETANAFRAITREQLYKHMMKLVKEEVTTLESKNI